MSLANIPENTASTKSAVDTSRKERTILVVEDEENIRNLLVSVLGSAGYALLQAANGSDALELCTHCSRRVDLLITDCTMPLMSGLELVERVRPSRPEMRVILLSGKNPDTLRKIRGVTVLPKPFTIKGLLTKISDVLSVAV